MTDPKSTDLPSQWTHEPHKILRFRTGDKIADIDTDASPGFTGKRADAEEFQAERNEHLAGLQELLYADGKGGNNRSLLLVLQGMDTAGKGSIVKRVLSGTNPMGIRYTGFGPPTEEERAHHYLWRINNALPPAGHIGVFDRSHYEDVLVVRVHDLVPRDVWEGRYDEINTQAGRAPRPARALLEVQPARSRRAQAVARLSGGVSGGVGSNLHRLRAVVRGAVRQEVVQPVGRHRTSHRGPHEYETHLAGRNLRRRGREKETGWGLISPLPG